MQEISFSARETRQPGGIGLSFSGGGFRATAFSLGTLTLLQDLGLLSQARAMSSVSGGSLALAAYVCAKAGADAQRDVDFRFEDLFFRKLMGFLETDELATAFVNINQLLQGDKLICNAADATHHFLNELLQGEDEFSTQEALLGNEKITEMLANHNLSPDYIFFNATNITTLDLFRFGIQRNKHQDIDGIFNRPVFVLNRYFLQHNRESAEGKTLYHYAQKLRLADCVAASFAFPGGFEPLLFPDDFFRARQDRSTNQRSNRLANPNDETRWQEAKTHFRNDLICDHKQYLALLDGGLYDNLGLASIEDIRNYLLSNQQNSPASPSNIAYVIATDVDQIPTQYRAYSDPALDAELTGRPKTGVELDAIDKLLLVISTLCSAAPLLVFLAKKRLEALFSAPSTPDDSNRPKTKLGLADTYDSTAGLNSWLDVCLQAWRRSIQDHKTVWQAINARRIGQLLPSFSGYLKRTRSLTYGYIQQAYRGEEATHQKQHCHLIRNMIFELTPGIESDPDYASKLITLPIKNYRHEQSLDPVSPIVSKIIRAKSISSLLQQVKARAKREGAEKVRFSLEDIDLGAGQHWTAFAIETKPTPEHWENGSLLLSLLTQEDGRLLGEAQQIISDLNLLEADQIWRWLCNNLACFANNDDSGCVPAHPSSISIPVGNLVASLNRIFHQQIGENHTLLDRCLVSIEETTASYSWIPLICEMATNVPTTLWLKDQCWYTPNRYDNQQRIQRNGEWALRQPSHTAPEAPAPIDCTELGPAPAAAVCTVAGYVSMCFNLLEFFYSWIGDCTHAQERLLERLKRMPFPFARSASLHELAELPYALRQATWRRLKQEEREGTLPETLLQDLALLEYPLNRRNGLPESLWAGGRD